MNPSKSSEQESATEYWWLRGALMVAIASLLGLASLALFCHAYGLNFQDEGWASSDGNGPQVKQGALIASIVGTLIATVLFWWGFIRATRKKGR
ncbi:MAG: hypothetical protein HKN47_14990 [Pirellulaceae bacterium]|nr:hypothetical protein [Pirellulaceae bacterium]